MAAAGAHVFLGGRPLTRKGKKDGGLSKDDKVGNVTFIEDNRNEIRQLFTNKDWTGEMEPEPLDTDCLYIEEFVKELFGMLFLM